MPLFNEKPEGTDWLEVIVDVMTGVGSVAAVLMLLLAFEYVRGA